MSIGLSAKENIVFSECLKQCVINVRPGADFNTEHVVCFTSEEEEGGMGANFLCGTLSQRGLNPIKLAYDLLRWVNGWLSH